MSDPRRWAKMKPILVALIALLWTGCYSTTLIDARRPSVVALVSANDLDGTYSESGRLYRHIYRDPVITNMTPDFPSWNEYGSLKAGTFTLKVSEKEVAVEGSDGTQVRLQRETDPNVRDSSPMLRVSSFRVGGESLSGYGSGTARLMKGTDGSIVIEYDIIFELRSLFMPYQEREIFWAVYEKKN